MNTNRSDAPGREEIRAICERYRAIRTLKRRYGGGPIPDEALDRAVPPVDCYKTRIRLRLGRSPRNAEVDP